MRTGRRLRMDARPLEAVAIALGLAVAAASVGAWAASGDDAGTPRPGASASGDVAAARARSRRVVLTEQDPAAEDATEEVEHDPTDEPVAGKEDAPTAAEEPVATPRVLRLVDESGAPVEGVAVCWPERDGMRSSASDEHGEIAVPCGTEPRVVEVLDTSDMHQAELVESLTIVTVARPRMLDVEVVDGTTGLPLSGSALSVRRVGAWSRARGLSVALGTLDGLSVVPPVGYGCSAAIATPGPVARRARRVRVIVPVYPGTTWTFRALDRDGRPVAGAMATAVEESANADRPDCDAVTFRSDVSGGDGVVRVSDVPRIPYLRALRVSLRGAGTCGTARVSWADEARSEPIDVVLNGGGWYRGPAGECSCGYAREVDDPTPRAPLVVQVRWRDGVAAANVRVVCCGVTDATTDAEGRAKFDALPVGPAFFVAGAHGFLPTAARAVVGRDETIEIVEDEPRTVHVLVTDEQGRALPAARVTVESERIAGPEGTSLRFCESIAQLDGDVELLTPLTDGAGRVAVSAARGEMRYEVTIGGASARVYAEAGDDVHVTVTGER